MLKTNVDQQFYIRKQLDHLINLFVWFDSDFSFSKHVQNVCKCCFIQLRDFRNIRQFLAQDAAVSVANAFVSSQLDYCNSLFRSFSKSNLHRLQSIQKVQLELLHI